MAFDEGERLIVQLEARVSDFERQMKRAERTGTNSYGRLQQGSKRATAAMEQDMVRSTGRINAALATTSSKIGALGTAFNALKATAAVGALMTIGKFAVETADKIARVGDEAQKAGLSAQAFQKWAIVAERTRIPLDAMTDAFKELSLRGDEFATTGAGSAAQAFQRLGFSAEDVKGRLADTDALMLAIIDRVQYLDQAAQIRVFDELFGGQGGEEMVKLLDEGEAGIRRIQQAAAEAGVIMSDDLIHNADVLSKQFQTLAQDVRGGLVGAINEAAAALVTFIGKFQSFQAGVARFWADHPWLAAGAKAVIGGNPFLKGLAAPAGALGLTPQQGGAPLPAGIDGALAAAAAEATRAKVEAANRAVIAANRGQFGPALPPGWTAPAAPSTGSTGGGRSGGGRSGGGGSAAADRPDDLARATAQIEKRTAALQAETAAQAALNPLVEDYGFAAQQAKAAQELLTAAQQAGVQITPELRAQIGDLAGAYAAASAEAKRLGESQADAVKSEQALAGLKRDVVGGLIEGLREGTDAATLLSQALTKVADYYLDLALKGMFTPTSGGAGGGGILGAIAHALGGLFGFADGGYTGAGGRTQPAGIVHAGEYVFSKQAVEAMGVGRLEAMHRAAKRGYADGGAVGRSASPAATSGPNIKIVNTLDSADVLAHALATERGQRVLVNHVASNSRRFKALLS